MALPRGLRGGRVDDRLGDALEGGELPPRCRAAAGRPGRQPRSMARPRCALPCGTCPFRSSPTPATPRRSPRSSISTTRRCSPRQTPSLTCAPVASITLTPSKFSSWAMPTAPSPTDCPTARPRPAPKREAGCSASGSCGPVRPRAPQRLRGRAGLRQHWGRRRDATAASSTGTHAPAKPAHLYLPGPHRGVWNEQALSGGEVIICESLIDALSFWCAGFRNVTASYGTQGFTEEHLAAFTHHGVKTVPHRLRPRPSRRRGRRKTGRRADGLGHRVPPGRVPLRGGC